MKKLQNDFRAEKEQMQKEHKALTQDLKNQMADAKAAADEALAETVKKANEEKEELRKEMDEKITTLMGDMAE